MPSHLTPWNKGKLVGQKAPLRLSDIWSIRVRLQLAGRARDLAMFNLAIDSKLRGCDLVSLRPKDVSHGSTIARRTIVLQRKTGRPVQFELTEMTRSAIADWSRQAQLASASYLFPGRAAGDLSTRQYARIVESWVTDIGLDRNSYGTHSMRRTKASLIYRRTKNLRAVQILLGHTKLESTVRYLGIEVEDALEMAEQTEAKRTQLLDRRPQGHTSGGRFRPKADIRLSACSGPCSARLFIGLLAGAGALYDQAASGGESNIRCAVDKSYNRTQGSGY